MRPDAGLRKIFTKELQVRGLTCTAVESGGTTSGLGDIYWTRTLPQASGWIECKATTGWAVKMRPHQIGFSRRCVLAGVRHAVAVRASGVGSGGSVGDSLWLVRGQYTELLSEQGLKAMQPEHLLGYWEGPPKSWPWDDVARLLMEPPPSSV